MTATRRMERLFVASVLFWMLIATLDGGAEWSDVLGALLVLNGRVVYTIVKYRGLPDGSNYPKQK